MRQRFRLTSRRLLALLVLVAAAILPAAAHGAVGLDRTSSPTFYVDGSTFSDAFPKIRANYTSYRITNDAFMRADVWVRITDFTGSTITLAPNEDELVHVGAMAAGEQRTAFFYLQSSAATGSGSHTIRVYDGRPGDGGVELASATYLLTVSTQGFNNANKVSSVTVSPANPSLGGLVTVVVNGETGTIGAANISSFTPASDVGFPAAAFQLESTQITFNQSSCPSATRNCSTLVDTLLIPTSSMPSSQNTPYTATYRFRATNVTTASTAVSPLAYISSGQSPSHTSTGVFATLPPIDAVANTLTLAKSADRALVNATEESRTVEYSVTVSNTSPFAVSFDDVVDTTPAGALYVAGSARWGGATIPAPTLSGGKLTFVAPFTVPGAGSRTLTYRLLLAPVDGTATNSAIGHSSATRLDTTLVTTDDSPAQASVTVDVTPPPLTVTGGPAERTNATNATLLFSSADLLAMFECLAPGSAVWAPCASGVTYGPLGEGAHAFSVRTTDLAGNSTAKDVEWVVDLTPPTIVVSGPASPTSSHDAEFTFTADEPATYLCSLDGAPEAPCASPHLTTEVGNGEHVLTVRAVDEAGNEAVETWEWEVDGPPLAFFLSGPDAATAATTAAIAFAADRVGSTFECKVDAGEWLACTSPLELINIVEGPHAVLVRATSPAGTGDPASYVWTVDLTTPTTTIQTGPTSPARTRTHMFTFSADEHATFECRWSWDDGGFWPCTSGDELDAGRDGAFALQVRALDEAGNVGGIAEWAVTIDTVAPAVAFTATPADSTTETNGTFAFSADEPVLFACSLDGGEFVPCSEDGVTSGTFDVAGLVVGSHAFTVRATDVAGNATEETYAWTVAGRPVAAFDETPGATSGSSATFAFSAVPDDEGTNFECSLDEDAWAPCESPLTVTGLADGPHALSVRASNEHGTGEPAEHAWAVDAVAPVIEITDAPAALVRTTTTSFSFTSDENASFACALDAAELEPCESPHSFEAAEGGHTFRVRAMDAVGNASEVVEHTWTVDTSAPFVALGDVPPELSASAEALFTFTSGDEQAVFECSLDDGAFEECETPLALVLSDGPHRLAVRALDPAGNASEGVSHSWTIDTTAPSVALDNAPPAVSTSAAATFAFSSGDPDAVFECSLDGSEPEPCESPFEAELADGPHAFSVRPVDAAGNRGEAVAHEWTIDATPPTASIPTGPDAETTSSSATFTLGSDDGDATFECALDDGEFAPCESPLELTGLAPGPHALVVRVTDPAGNTSTSSWAWTILQPTPPPFVSILSGPESQTEATAATFFFTTDREGVEFECSLDGAEFAPCTSPLELTGLTPGGHELRVRAVDEAGTSEHAAHEWTVVEPNPPAPVPPVASVTGGPLGETGATVASFTFTADQGDVTFECSLDGGPWVACASPLQLTDLAVGDHMLAVRALNGAGAGEPDTWNWTVLPPASEPGTPVLELEVTDAAALVVIRRAAPVQLVLRNIGDADATGVLLEATTPEGVVVSQAGFMLEDSAPSECPRGAGTATCAVGALPAGGVVTVALVVRAGRPGPYTIHVAATADELDPIEAGFAQRATRCTIIGTPANDRLVGTAGDDVICGLKGHDTIVGGGGRDVLLGGSGNDRISGGRGKDRLRGGPGDDRLAGGSGNDLVTGGLGKDTLDGGAGRDTLAGGAHGDVLWGRKGRDLLDGGAGPDTIHSHDGFVDRVVGGFGRDRWYGDRIDRANAVEWRRVLA